MAKADEAKKIVISVSNIYKDFKFSSSRSNTIKSLFMGIFHKKDKEEKVQHALRDISFDIKEGEFFGIVGRNGSGKSTLLKILAGIYQPTEGNVQVKGKLVPFIELGVGFNPELTGKENVYLNGAMLGFSNEEIDGFYDEVVEFAELEKFMDKKLKNYSSGMQVRLAFSVATRAKADILLIDEVLAVGDADFQRKCFDYFQQLKGSNTTVVFVTHDMNAVREYCDRAILIEKSKLVISGSAQKVASQYTRMFMEEGKHKGKQKKENRWGDAAVTYSKIEVTNPRLKDNEETLVFKTWAKAAQDIDAPIFGFLIKNAAGANILGTNSQILQNKIPKLKAGQTIQLEWRVPNIFNDGVHYIDPAIVYKGGTQVADWWEDAVSFTSLREKRTPYIVNPDITLNKFLDHEEK